MPITIRGAQEHNLQHIDVDFGDGLTVVTGVSGSGKTSLVFDVLYHEARRRFLEVFSLGAAGQRLAPARVQAIGGLGPAVAVGQNLLNRNPNSTLATAAGLHPFLRLLYARFGRRHCRRCGAGLAIFTEDEVVERLVALSARGPTPIRVPLLHGVQGSHATLLGWLVERFGPDALFVDGHPWQPGRLDPARPHDLAVELGCWPGPVPAARAREAVRAAAALGASALSAGRETLAFAPVCPECGTWFGPLEPVHFHTPCSACRGRGCAECGGTGLHPEAAAVRWEGRRLPELLACPAGEVQALVRAAELPDTAARLRQEIASRLEALEQVGLGYITLDRPAPTLSRGEAQRVRLAVALAGHLEDMLHVLDEPTVGQHPADVARLLPALRRLPGPVIFVEHDRTAAAMADQAVDLGPGAGHEGGRLLFSGPPADLWSADTPTGRYFSGRERVIIPAPHPAPERFLVVRGADLRTLQNIDVPLPLGRLTVITGVSGSGKSTLVEDVLVASLLEQKPVGCREIEGPALKPVLVDQGPIGHNPRSNPATYTNLADLVRDYFAAATGLSPSHFSFNRPEGACPECQGMGALEVKMRYLPSTWIPCSACDGQRFSETVLAARTPFGRRSLSIAEFYELDVDGVLALLSETEAFQGRQGESARSILEALRDIGLGYISLGQPSPTLSGGEAQRVKLAKYLGQRSLARRLLVLDEPSTGLHPQDIAGLLVVLDRLVRAGATVVVVEHNTDVIRAADWVVDLGPGAGPEGGRLLYAGPVSGLSRAPGSRTGKALAEEANVRPWAAEPSTPDRRSTHISIRGARAHNLQDVSVDIPKGALTVFTGVSGSGKSSLVGDVLEAEARRRFLETLSLYERQGTREGPEAPVESIGGLGVTIAIGTERGRFDYRATVGTATEIAHHLAILLSLVGERRCLECGAPMVRGEEWRCPSCGATAPVAKPRHFTPSHYAAACRTCQGVGSLQAPRPDKLIVQPELPLCGGAMYSPGFFPKGYLCKPYNHGYSMVRALAARYGFDPTTTPWDEMTPEAQRAFLFGDSEPLSVTHEAKDGRVQHFTQPFPGFYGFIRDWDVGGTYTETVPCPECKGGRLRPEYLAVTLGQALPGQKEPPNAHALGEMPLRELARLLDELELPAREAEPAGSSLRLARQRLRFLLQVGLGYLHLNRVAATLSAGEAQRVRLASLLGSELTSLTVLLDEPSRGLHPAEVEALLAALQELRDEGNTVIVVEHDPLLIRAADYLVDMGPGAGAAGGQIVAQGRPEEVARSDTPTARWLRGERQKALSPRPRRQPRGWIVLRGARAHNLSGEEVHFPRGVLLGVCGLSGSGKSTLLIDTLGRALAPVRHTTSVAYEPLAPGEYESIKGAPERTIVIDQSRAGVTSPAALLELDQPLRALYAASEDAQALGLDEAALSRRCSVCGGSGSIRLDMEFLPAVHTLCETCQGTGLLREAWDVKLRGLALPEVLSLTIDQLYGLFGDQESLAGPLQVARDVGLGYLVLRQPGYALSGGEAQRLKIARELGRKAPGETLYLLDEPTVGQHLEDVLRLNGVLHRLVDQGHSVLVVEHHPLLLAACDWLLELGPGGGPDGGRVIASGTPEEVAAGSTPIAAYLREG